VTPSGSDEDWLRVREAGVEVRVRLVPRSSRDGIDGRHGDRLKIRLTAPPVDGEANEALRRFLARTTGVRVADVRIVAGQRSRSKTVLLGCDRHSVVAERLRLAVSRAVDNPRGRT